MSAAVSTMQYIVEITNAGAFVQELMVLLVFAISFLLWNKVSYAAKEKKTRNAALAKEAKLAKKQRSADESTEQQTPVAKEKQVVPPHVQASEQQMLRLLEGREFTRALNMYRSLERDGRDKCLVNEELFSSFIQSAIRVGKVDVVERMLRAMKRNGIPPSLKFWQTTLKMLSSRKHFTACVSIHSLFGKSIPADKVVFSCLINAALESGMVDRAPVMLARYKEGDIDAKDHVLFFRTFVATGDVDSAEATFHELGQKTTTLMLNLLLLTCVNAKQADRALRLLKEAHELEAGLPEVTEEGHVRIVDAVSYNTVIKGFAQAGQPTKCFDCLQAMRENGLEPDDVTLGTLLDVCIVENNTGAVQEVVDLLIKGDRPMDTVMCTLFIKGLVRANFLQKASDLYDEMKVHKGATPDVVTYSVLIKAFVDAHDLERALQLLADMTEAKLMPDDIILTHLLEGCRHAGNHVLGKRLFDEMLAAGVAPSEFTLITMVKLHGRCGAHEEAHELVANWEKQHGSKPSVIHYTCLMSGCLRSKCYSQAWAAYELMCANGVQPDEMAITTLIPGMVAAQQWDNVITLVNRALKGPQSFKIPTETLNSALLQMRASSANDQAAQLQALMQAKGMSLPVRSQQADRK
eukprot:gnl/TRDRNA2_/TRDRNA2_164199_c0_seq3.p1 gnl/TRDRNA2_/TRDRNA2_164199_c0~~gnl/TRDRNA2_/TRDRNA2_164199_c0_seq3.p1  ORF type:complete len:635 (-),score=180.53 gnl/TRDRNA2_/TRDRNA2_164199_c0_seq3:38-1942(-)